MSCSRTAALCLIFVCAVIVLKAKAQSNGQPNPSTPAAEASALNSVFRQWRISATQHWNISGEPCSGAAINSTSFDSDQDFNPAIICDCSYNNASTCHITQLKVYAMSVSGTIPTELWNLTYLQNLILSQNLLSGSLSPLIGNLMRMEYLTVGINSLSGELPKEIGSLTQLKSLSFGSNNFSGSLLSEIGNLLNLEQLYFDSSGIGGEIPLTFANLTNMQTLWGSDTGLTGSIPDFIGTRWSKLRVLRLQGNLFQGAIPSSLSNLIGLTDLRISEISNGTSSLDFIQNMTLLSTLILRNNNITGSIPSDIGKMQDLLLLDLSFNDLTGGIPSFLFNLSSLINLFLGSNKLTGTLASQNLSSLRNIDLSYNDLSGSLPSWINDENFQVNLVGNNFTMESLSSSTSGLGCLQKDFGCNRGPGIYFNFSIKCGGPQIRSSSGIVYERENETLGPASYAVSTTQRWAVSNVGLFADNNNPAFTTLSSSQFTNTVDSEIFQTARLSASSLRYYGLGLENGNYTVTLQFAESVIPDSTWRRSGRRVFDIFVQGGLVLKDFDIKREAGGASFRAVRKDFKALVSENYLEIHLFWAGKGTCCIPFQATYGPIISAISATPDFIPTVNNIPASLKKAKHGPIIGVSVSVAAVFLVSACAIYYWFQKRGLQNNADEFIGIAAKPYTFTYLELKGATEDFSALNKLGEGGFGQVFKGVLSDRRDVAVKRLSVASHHGKNQFVAEIATVSGVQHRNLVKLYGCCIEGQHRLLVYEYLENRSLDQALFGTKSNILGWETRYDICLGIARGLVYLHEESQMRIIHRDVKASNILLDHNLVPKISDFGLAKLFDDQKTHISTRVAGTIGYLAPEYAMRGQLTEKIDVFGFGVVALEIVSGRPNTVTDAENEGERYLLEWAWHLFESKRETELVDHRLHDQFSRQEAARLIAIALLCTQTAPSARPAMSRVVSMLSGDVDITSISSKPGYLTEWQFNDITSSFTADSATSNIGTTTTPIILSR